MLKIDPIQTPAPVALESTARDDAIREQAKEFEAVFIAQMLKHSGFEKALSAESGFGGENYASLLLERYASEIVDNGGFGLADKIYQQLKAKEAGDGTEQIV